MCFIAFYLFRFKKDNRLIPPLFPNQAREDSTDGVAVSSDASRFDELNFNMDDFVTVDEVGGESSPKPTSKARKERQPATKLSSSSKSSKDVVSSSSASPKQSKSSLVPAASPVKPPASASKTSRSSSPLPTETPSGLGDATQSSAKESPSVGTRSSSSEREPKGVTTVSTESRSEPLLDEKNTESTAATPDHDTPAESVAAETTTSPEVPPPEQEQETGLELSHAQSPEIAINANALEEQKETKEERKGDDDTDVEILDSLDGQTEEPMEDGDQASGSEAPPIEGQALHDEGVQVSESVDDEVNDEVNAEIGGSLQASDSVTEGEAAKGPEDDHLVQEDTVKQMSEDHDTSHVETLQVSDTGSEHTDGNKRKEEEVQDHLLFAESCNTFKDVDNPNEDRPLPDPENKDALKDPQGDVTEPEAFEILDSIDDLNSAEDESQNLKISSEQISKEDIGPVEEEEDEYQVIDSVGDQPMTTEPETGGKGKRKGGKATTRKAKRVSKKDKEVAEDAAYKIVDSVEDEPVQEAPAAEPGRRRSTRGKKEDKGPSDLTEAAATPEDASFRTLDSVDEPTPRPARGKRGRPKKEAPNEKSEAEEAPTKRRQTQERLEEKTPKQEEGAPPSGESTPATVFDSVEDEVVQVDPPPPKKRGRPKKDAKTPKKGLGSALKKADKDADKDASKNATDEEEATYRILDSVGGEAVDDRPPAESTEETSETVDQTETSESPKGSPKKEDEEGEEPTYCIVDSLDDGQVQEQPMTTEDGTNEETPPPRGESPAGKEDAPAVGEEAEEAEEAVVEEETLFQIVDDLESGDEPSAASGSAEAPGAATLAFVPDAVEVESIPESPGKDGDASGQVSLDEVSDEEENYPDDADEEEEKKLRKRQAAAKERHIAEKREARRTREREERRTRGSEERRTRVSEERRTRDSERRSRSRSSSRGGGGGGGGSRREKEAAVDPKEMVTLDEVGADDTAEEGAPGGKESDGEITEGEMQALVTLDEFIGEEEEQEEAGKEAQSPPEPHPPSQEEEEESVDFLNSEVKVKIFLTHFLKLKKPKCRWFKTPRVF